MSKVMTLIAYTLLIIGTIGLLVNEFAADWGRVITILFAIFNVVGLVTLALTGFKKKRV